MHWTWLALPALGYLLGSIPSGVLLGRLVGRDPRTAGSGNIGASNVTRTLGRKLGAATLVLDAAKGGLPTWLGLWLGGVGVGALAGGMAVVGHCYPVWLRFKGGKGVATAFGVIAVCAPAIALIGAIVWAFCLAITRVPAIGSIAATALFVVLVRLDGRPFEIQLLSLALFGLILLRHTSNLRVLKARYLERRARRERRIVNRARNARSVRPIKIERRKPVERRKK